MYAKMNASLAEDIEHKWEKKICPYVFERTEYIWR